MKLCYIKMFGLFAAASTISAAFAGSLAEAPLGVSPPVPSNVIFPLSVEFPTAVTAAYLGTNDYSSATIYLGIFNPKTCYTYSVSDGWFSPSTSAIDQKCNGAWSGNFLNWATMTGLDEFRVAMTGGNRYKDTTELTVLERTYMSASQGTEDSNFPKKSPTASSIVGAVPTTYAALRNIVNLHQDVRMAVTSSTGTVTNFFVRAQVCTSINRESNCTAYGTSPYVYKPTGSVQKYGEKMRFGVFSYFNSTSIDNAVMRSKAKYVAPQKWTASGSTSNDNREWDESTGILTINPDPTEASNSKGGTVTNSGVINYINKFGTYAKSYKTYDNFGKLIYESLRYLRGIGPTTEFSAKATSGNGDGFPMITNWDDPIQYRCQKNFIMAMGDTHIWCDKRLPGGSFTSTNNSQCNTLTGANGQAADVGSLAGDADLDVSLWTNALGAMEGAASLATTANQNGASYYTAGMAYWAAYKGIRPSTDLQSHSPSPTYDNNIKVKTYIIDVLENRDLGINGNFWRAAKYGGADSHDNAGAPVDWSTSRTVLGTTYANWPKTLLPAGDPASMKAAVETAMSSIAAQSVQPTSSTPSSSNLTTSSDTGANVYATTFDPSKWTGDVVARILDVVTLSTTTVAWTASAKLPTWSNRKILTFNDGLKTDGTASEASDARKGVSFLWDNLSPRQQAFLSFDPATSSPDSYGSARVDYIRGSTTNEGNNGQKWRTRSSRLGDFINSAPVLVKAPPANVNDSDYADYRTLIKDRTPMLYIGGNDGMLHAFNAAAKSDGTVQDATTGREIFAYVPSAVFSKLNKLSWPDYSHLYYVDATPVSAEAKLFSCDNESDTYKCWRSVLVGGLGAGGQGVYALNVTDPANLASASANDLVMWEFTDRDDADLGFTFSQPIVRKMNNGRWAVIFGNGYNSKESDDDVGNIQRRGDGRAFLYVLFLDGPTGAGRSWQINTDYYKIKLTSPDETADNIEQNGLSTVNSVDTNNDGKTDLVYAGDRRGNLWKIDLSSSTPADWKTAFGTVDSPEPLFVAKTTNDAATATQQQVTTSPVIGRHPKGGYLVMFGTGSYIETSDTVSPFALNHFYGIWDKNDATMSDLVPIARNKLQRQKTLATKKDDNELYALQSDCQPQYETTAQTWTATGTCPTSLKPAVLDAGGKVEQQLGWALELNYAIAATPTGERYMANNLPTLQSNLLTFKSLTTSTDPCAGAGEDFLYNIDYRTGGRYGTPVFIAIAADNTATTRFIDFGTAYGGTTYATSKQSNTNNGQNPSFTRYSADKGKANSSAIKIGDNATFGACQNFVAGRPCLKDLYNMDIDSKTIVRAVGSGSVSWRQLP